MKQAFVFAVGAAVVIGGLTYQALHLSAAEKVKVCHRTGNGRAHVIEINDHAVPAHLNHGDSLDVPEGLEHGDDCEITEAVEK
jgi:cupin superfamily acireductone dioxygenase involved in methionine salvage